MTRSSIKWRLMLSTLPLTLVVLALKLILILVLDFEGLVKFSDVGLVVTGGMFLIGFMLAGTMSDYKESERIPAELASILESLEDTCRLAAAYKGGFDLKAVQGQLLALTDCMVGWFHRGCSTRDVFDGIHNLTDIALTLERAGVGAIASRITGEQHNLRKLFARVNVIRNTHFLATGYALLEVLSVVIMGLLLIARFDELFIAIIIVSFITQIFVYMIRLIRDVDEPFEYAESGLSTAADVDLFPVTDYRARLAERVA